MSRAATGVVVYKYYLAARARASERISRLREKNRIRRAIELPPRARTPRQRRCAARGRVMFYDTVTHPSASHVVQCAARMMQQLASSCCTVPCGLVYLAGGGNETAAGATIQSHSAMSERRHQRPWEGT